MYVIKLVLQLRFVPCVHQSLGVRISSALGVLLLAGVLCSVVRFEMDLLMESSWTGSARFERVPSLSPKFVLDLPVHLVRELTDSFEFFDRNGDGRISQDELGAVMRSLGQSVSDADLARLVHDVNANGDGFIELYEFIELNTRPYLICTLRYDVIEWTRKNKQDLVISVLDFEKAYVRINWTFLESSMHKLRFSETQIRCMLLLYAHFSSFGYSSPFTLSA